MTNNFLYDKKYAFKCEILKNFTYYFLEDMDGVIKMDKVKRLLSLVFFGVFLNISVIDTNGMKLNDKEQLLKRKIYRNNNEEETKISYGKDLPSIKKQVEEHNQNCKEGYKITYWGDFKPCQFFQRIQYLVNPVAFQHSSNCSLNLFSAYANNKFETQEIGLWSIDKVRRQMNSGQDSDIEGDYISEKGTICKKIDYLGIRGHIDRCKSFIIPRPLTKDMDVDERNLLAFMYKYIQTNRHSEPKMNRVYFSSKLRENFIKYFNETKDKNYIIQKLYTPFGNLKVKRGSSLEYKKIQKILRQVHIYRENDTAEKYYSYNDIGDKFNELDIGKRVKILELINEYLSTKDSYENCKEKWQKQVDDLGLEDKDKDIFAILFGIAVLAEPLRECDDGTSQRCVYKTMLYYLNKLKNNEIKLETDEDWEKLVKDLESGNHNKHKNLFKFYQRVREKAQNKKRKMDDKKVLKFFEIECKEF